MMFLWFVIQRRDNINVLDGSKLYFSFYVFSYFATYLNFFLFLYWNVRQPPPPFNGKPEL